MKTTIEGLKFQPYVPENYYRPDNKYGKLLILGHSFYFGDDEECECEEKKPKTENLNPSVEVPTEIINKYLDGEGFRFYKILGWLLTKMTNMNYGVMWHLLMQFKMV
jgi:hypothetical protein